MSTSQRLPLRILSLPTRLPTNRYFSMLTSAMEERGAKVLNIRARGSLRFDVLHVHFPAHFVTQERLPVSLLAALALPAFFLLARLRRKPVIYTVHDVVPFSERRRWLWYPFLSIVHRLCSGFVFLSETSRDEFLATFSSQAGKPFVIIPHGPYPTVEIPTAEIARRRADILAGDDAFLLGFLGTIKAYKGLESLSALPSHTSSGRPVRTVIAGRAASDFETETAALLGMLPAGSFVRFDASPTDEELDEFMKSVDAVLLLYSKGWNSGAALLALSNGARIIASDLPIFRELQQDVGADWIGVAETTSLRTSILQVIDNFDSSEPSPTDRARLADYLRGCAFSVGAALLEEFYRQLM